MFVAYLVCLIRIVRDICMSSEVTLEATECNLTHKKNYVKNFAGDPGCIATQGLASTKILAMPLPRYNSYYCI